MYSVRDRLHGIPAVSEADPDFEERATPAQLAAAERSAKAAGVVEVEPDWERKATPAQREARRQQSLRQEKKAEEAEVTINKEIFAKYKIEVTFTHQRRLNGENECGIQFWESGKRFHGGGDEMMHICVNTSEPDPRKRQGCQGFIPASDINSGIAYCRSCQKGIVASKLSNWYYMKGTPTKIATKLAEFFRRLDCKADIYLKYHKTDIRYIAMERAKGPDVARRYKGMHIYPLKNILIDTAFGADIAGRFKAFLTS